MTGADFEKPPSWQVVKGQLIHRGVLASMGKWLTIDEARQVDAFDGLRTPHLVAEARWIARRLSRALRQDDERTVRSLIDSGGPRWSLTYDDFKRLNPPDQARALENLESLTVTVAMALLQEAEGDGWRDLLSEVVDPYALLTAHTERQRQRANRRIDLLVNRWSRPPLLVDLKTGEHFPDIMAEVHLVARKYGRQVAAAIDGPVHCRVLGLTHAGYRSWSETVVVSPR